MKKNRVTTYCQEVSLFEIAVSLTNGKNSDNNSLKAKGKQEMICPKSHGKGY